MSLGCVPWCHMKKLRSKSVCEQKGSCSDMVVTGAFQTNRSVSVEGKCMVVDGTASLNIPIERSSYVLCRRSYLSISNLH